MCIRDRYYIQGKFGTSSRYRPRYYRVLSIHINTIYFTLDDVIEVLLLVSGETHYFSTEFPKREGRKNKKPTIEKCIYSSIFWFCPASLAI